MKAKIRRKLTEGTEVLRTGGGASLTASECHALLDEFDQLSEVAEAARGVIEKSRDEEDVEWIGLLPGGQQRLWTALVALGTAE